MASLLMLALAPQGVFDVEAEVVGRAELRAVGHSESQI